MKGSDYQFLVTEDATWQEEKEKREEEEKKAEAVISEVASCGLSTVLSARLPERLPQVGAVLLDLQHSPKVERLR